MRAFITFLLLAIFSAIGVSGNLHSQIHHGTIKNFHGHTFGHTQGQLFGQTPLSIQIPVASDPLHTSTLGCNKASRQRRTIIQKPSQLDSTAACRYTFEAYNTNVCQLLVQFEEFELQQPVINSVTGAAECQDRLEIGNFSLCGKNSQQHLYIPFPGKGTSRTLSMTFTLPNKWPQSRWRLAVTQLNCPSFAQRTFGSPPPDELAPLGCDQYFTQPTGNIKSFNYDGLSSIYQPNLHYTICIKSTTATRNIQYNIRSFSLGLGDPNSQGYDFDCRSTIMTTGRDEDWLMIPQSYLASIPVYQPTYYCGKSLIRNDIVEASAPFVMTFHSDGISRGNELGFSIDFRVIK